jgi:hypothetical protein
MIDPRDGRWELWTSDYRVDFWRPYGIGGWASREFEVSGGDVSAVIRWADDHASDNETYAVYAIVKRGEGPGGLVHLLGDDPTRNA